MELEEYNFFDSIVKKPKHWTIDDQGQLTAKFTYNGMGKKRLPGTSLEVEFPEVKDVSFTRKQLQNISRELYTRMQQIESELCEIELDEDADDEARLNWASLFGVRIMSEQEQLLETELKMAQHAQKIVTDTLGITETALEA